MNLRYRSISAPGQSALGIIALSGSDAGSVLADLFRPRNGRPFDPARVTTSYGEFVGTEGTVIDDGCVVPVVGSNAKGGGASASFDAPAPFDYWLTLHGNPVLLDELIRSLRERGGRVATEAISAAALAVSRPQPEFEREALSLLPSVRTERAAAWLLEQCDPRGTGMAAWLTRVRSSEIAAEEIREVADRRWGLGLVVPASVVLSGVPNAGKSTLFNRWVGRRRVVEHATPGTTRDLIEEFIHIRGFPMRLVDGAGVRDDVTDRIEAEGVRRALRARAAAGLVVELIPPGADASGGPSTESTPTLKIRSRLDQIPPTRTGDSEALLAVSGKTGEGLEDLERAVLRTLYGIDDAPRGIPAPFTKRQVGLLREAATLTERKEDARGVWDRI